MISCDSPNSAAILDARGYAHQCCFLQSMLLAKLAVSYSMDMWILLCQSECVSDDAFANAVAKGACIVDLQRQD